ncbi:retrovirus-related Pol polyprotein from transposon 297 [Trichonephila clavipes]|nr:retrovirus-related Pol polyprotein from transposon 297 [Trichonephila clavipes]
MPIVSKYPNEIVTLDLLGPYPASRPERYKFILVISDHFTKWCELIPLRKASAQAIANAFFDNYIARYGAPISLISDNGPQFISDVFEHLSHRLDIKHMKTVRVYRPRQSDTISSDSPVETLYDEQEVSHGSNRSHQGQFKEHRKTSSQESEGYRSRQGNTTREIPRNKRKINSTASKDQALKRSKICKKRSRQGDLIIRTGKDALLSKGRESRGRSLPQSRPGIISFKNIIPLHQGRVHCRSIKVA